MSKDEVTYQDLIEEIRDEIFSRLKNGETSDDIREELSDIIDDAIPVNSWDRVTACDHGHMLDALLSDYNISVSPRHDSISSLLADLLNNSLSQDIDLDSIINEYEGSYDE